jgi:cytochrome P450
MTTRTADHIPLVPEDRPFAHTLAFRRERAAFLRRLAGEGDLFRMRLLDKAVVVVTGPDVLHELLVEKAASVQKSSVLRYVLYPLVGEGLFTSRGDLWRRQRRLMAPMFPPGQIARYAESMVACAQRDVDTWRDGATIDVARETTRIAMSVAGKTLFDAETLTEADDIGAALTVALRWSGKEVTSWLPITQMMVRGLFEQMADRLPGRAGAMSRAAADRLQAPLVYLTREDREMKEAVALLDRRVQRMIDDRRASGADTPDLLGRLLAARDEGDGARMSDKQVRDEILTLFVAGHETTATGLAWSLYLLARHPEIHRRARAEADALGRPPRHEDLPRLELAQRVFKEALRLYPPVPVFTRDAAADVEIGGYLCPKGTVFLLCPYATHHRADLWPDPERFDPDRFTPEAEAARPRHAFVPFSAGPRICIGNHFALMEAPLVLATILQRADLEQPRPVEVEPEVEATLRPKGGVPMRVRLRRAEDRPAVSP